MKAFDIIILYYIPPLLSLSIMNTVSLHNIMNIIEYYETQGLTEFKNGEMRMWFNNINMYHNIKKTIGENIIRIWQEKKSTVRLLIKHIQVLLLVIHIKINTLKNKNGRFKYIEETEVIMSSNIITQIIIDPLMIINNPLMIINNYSDIKYSNNYCGVIIELE